MNLMHKNFEGKFLFLLYEVAIKRGRLLHAPTNCPYFLHDNKLEEEYI
jgi:hypothetical protein